MLYSAQQLLVQQVTTSTVNTQITALNTALTVSATAVGAMMNGLNAAPRDSSTFPLIVYYVGQDNTPFRLREFGKRDTRVPVRLLYLSRHTTMASAALDIQIALEAMQTTVETLPGQQWSTTARYCVDVQDPVVEFVTYKISDEVIRHGGELRFVMLMRTEG